MKPMKRNLIGLGLAGGVLLVVLLGMWFLAATTPFSPGDVLYGVQYAAEQGQIALSLDPSVRARMSFAQVELRLADIILAKDDRHVDAGIAALDECLTNAIRRIGAVDEAEREFLYADARLLLAKSELVLESLAQKMESQALNVLEEKVDVLLSAATPVELQQLAQEKTEEPEVGLKQVISFLGKDVNHGDFQLIGGHDDLQCDSCHSTGIYAGTTTDCASCHTLAGEMVNLMEVYGPQYSIVGYESLAAHYEGNCSDCHTIGSWEPYQFLHQDDLVECVSCHTEDAPADVKVAQVFDTSNLISRLAPQLVDKTFKGAQEHWPGDCIVCHQDLTDWDTVNFDHESDAAEDCATCHAFDAHENEYPGACTNCHNNGEDWLDVQVDHAEYRECLDCHADDDRPEGHFLGNCANCHSDEFWTVAFFDHTRDMDCKTCHTAPLAHTYSGQCVNCHGMDDWGDNVLDHTLQFCVSCHKAPDNHYKGQCSSCHKTGSWNIAANHTGLASCQDCHEGDAAITHYEGECSNCHVTDDWLNYNFSHTGLTECLSCHELPNADHYTNIACLTCHTTNNWNQIRVDHTLLPNCTTCHKTPVRHWPGECTLCHTTYSWSHIVYVHADNDNCLECHAKPDGHWSGQCSKCHVTTEWSMVDFDHTGFTDCKACHTRPANHPHGQCSNCHSTDTWLISTTSTVSSSVFDPYLIYIAPTPVVTTLPSFTTAP